MKYGYARVSTDGQSIEAQVRQLAKAGCKKVFREVASGAKTERAQLRRLLAVIDAGDVVTVTPLDPRSFEHPRGDHGQESRFPLARRHMGRYHDPTRPPHAGRSRRPSRVP